MDSVQVRPSRRRVLAGLAGAAAVGLAGAETAGVAAAQGQGAVVATGLAVPRGIALAEDGALFVTESGAGGSDTFTAPPPFGPSNRGNSGRVTRIARDGTKTTVAANLPSMALGGREATGPEGILIANGALWVTCGWSVPSVEQRPNEASLLRIALNGGAPTKVADFGVYERAVNPDGLEQEAHPHGIALGPDGNLYVADAGANVLWRVNPTSGQIGVATVFQGLPGQQPNPSRAGRPERDPVPVPVVAGPGGELVVGLLGGFPFPDGGSKVVRVAANGTVTDVATGLNVVSGLAFGPDGLLYVAEYGAGFNMTAQPPWPANSGRILRLTRDGQRQTVAGGLSTPGNMVFDRAGNLYVLTNVNTPIQAGPQGMVMRFDRVAAPSTAPAGVRQLPRTGDAALFGPAGGGAGLAGLALLAAGAWLRGRRA